MAHTSVDLVLVIISSFDALQFHSESTENRISSSLEFLYRALACLPASAPAGKPQSQKLQGTVSEVLRRDRLIVQDVLQGLDEDMTKPKSRLEREKEAAAAAAAKSGSTSELRRSVPNVRPKVAEAWQGQSLQSVMHKRKSKLEQDKENAAAAAAAANTSPKDARRTVPATRSDAGHAAADAFIDVVGVDTFCVEAFWCSVLH